MPIDNSHDDQTQSFISFSQGTEVSHYRIIEKIGSGGMGEVYLAEDTRLNRKVAMKFLPIQFCEDEDCRKRFTREAQAAARLDHPNIVTVHEVGEYKGRPFLTMAHVEGQTLKEYAKDKQLSVEQILEVGIQICDGLQAAHERGIIHRDIKPSNILVDLNGRARIVDFGLASVVGEDPLTKTGSTLGTISYMSPEQVQGRQADCGSDIFSLGIVLYEMITGELPFKGYYEAAIMYSIVNLAPKSLSEFRSDLPEKLQEVIDRALQKDPELRYKSVMEMSRDFSIVSDEINGELTKSSQLLDSIAVLNFSDLSAQKDQQFFCDGMAEEIINAMTKINGLRVVPRSSAFHVAKQESDPRKIGKFLGVDAVLEGSVRKAANRLRITAQLVDVDDGCYLWSEKYDRDVSDVFSVQDEIAKAIAEKLHSKTDFHSPQPLVRKYTDNIEAYDEYLKGRYYWNKRYEGGLQKAIQYFQKAIEYDPLYALAYTGLADSFNIIGFYNFLPPHEACTRAKAASLRALEIDSELAEAHTSLGWVATFYDWNWEKAEKEFRRAIELDPNYSIAHHYYGLFLLAMQRFEEAYAELRRALELDPLATIISSSLAAAYYFERRHEESIGQHLKALSFDPDFAIGHAFFAGPYVSLSQYDKAEQECIKAQSLSGGSIYPTAFLAYVYGAAGKKDQARRLLDELLVRSKSGYISSYHIALIYSGLGEIDNALEWLEKALDERDNWMVWLNIYPVFDILRDNPQFISIVKKVGLPDSGKTKS